jgi:hypothetical protein
VPGLLILMAYVLHTCKDGVNYCIRADSKQNQFFLVPVESDSDISQVFSHPYRIGAVNVLKWIQENDQQLASEELQISDRDRFRK